MVKSMRVPNEEGFWWGMWRIKADNTYAPCMHCGKQPTNDDVNEPPGHEWEVMHVVVNAQETDDPEHLMVMVPGVSGWQPLENFVWGPRVAYHTT